jgi:hypothetical protein
MYYWMALRGLPGGGNEAAEVVLDIVQAIGMAPGLSQVRVYIGQGVDDANILNTMAAENIAKQISSSWSWNPDDPVTDDVFFQEFAAQGLAVGCKRANHARPGAPHPDTFQTWFNWADKYRTWKDADHVAELWRRIRPQDIKPLLYLMESAEKRGAYRKSLKHLGEAEELDRLNPEVGRAKLRLLLSAAIHNLKQRKVRLVMVEIERMEALPEVREGEIAALASALRFLCAALDKDMAAMQRQRERLKALLSNVIPVHVLTNGLAKAAKLDAKVELPTLDVSAVPAVDLLSGVIRADTLGDAASLPLPLPWDWQEHLIGALDQFDCPTNITQMLVLGEVALRSELFKLAYAVSSAGLTNGAANARFLFLRARGLPVGQHHVGRDASRRRWNSQGAKIRAAYLRKVKEYPPERCPGGFESVRDAYDLLRDPRRRAQHMLFSCDPEPPLESLLDGAADERKYAGPERWLAVFKERK